MKVTKLVIALVCLIPFSLMAQNGFLVQGTIPSTSVSAKAYLNYYNEGKEVKDSVIVQQGTFSFKGQVNSPVGAILTMQYQGPDIKVEHAVEELFFYLENSKITITTENSFREATVDGSRSNDENLKLLALQSPYRKIADSVMKVYNSWTPEQQKDTLFTKSLAGPMQAAQIGYDSVSRSFIANNPHSFIALRSFKEVELAYNFNPDTAEARFSKFSASLRESYPGKQLAEIIETGKKTNTGVMAMDFVQPDTTGKEVKLSDFRGQYVLVDFWASWCKPCRAENPNLLKAYNKYKSKNFTILGISLDEEDGRRAWLHAVTQDGMPWTQVSDLKGFKSKTAIAYGVTAIPANFLISPEGKIVAKNLRGEELDTKLSEILGM